MTSDYGDMFIDETFLKKFHKKQAKWLVLSGSISFFFFIQFKNKSQVKNFCF